MCVAAVGALTFLTSALGSVASFVAQSQNAKAQEQYQQQLFQAREQERKENAENANLAYVRKAADLNLRSLQEQEKASVEKTELNIDAHKAYATALTSSKSSGIGLGNVLGDLSRQQGRYNNSIETQLHANLNQYNSELLGFRAEAIDRMNAIRPYIPQPVARPSPLGLVADIAGAGVSAYGKYKFS